MIDFKMVFISTFKDKFSTTDIKGCFCFIFNIVCGVKSKGVVCKKFMMMMFRDNIMDHAFNGAHTANPVKIWRFITFLKRKQSI